LQTIHFSLFDVFGPTVEFLTSPEETDSGYCVMIGTVPPGVSVPLHSHSDPESFYLLSGALEVLSERDDDFEWLKVRPGEFIHEPPGAKHAWRNTSREPAVSLVTTTPKLGRFFQEIGRPTTPGRPVAPPTPDDVQRFARVSAKYGYWTASPAENAAIGIFLPPPTNTLVRSV
jgi:quercetin dioxygenase-like cupin family protein